MNKLLFTYLPYGVIDLLLSVAIITELVYKRYDLLLSNLPVLIWGIVSLNKKLKANGNDLAD
ncbi:hypothetical protein HQ531_06785 [bacterium]|nr:hypothetical protein [bacterium]